MAPASAGQEKIVHSRFAAVSTTVTWVIEAVAYLGLIVSIGALLISPSLGGVSVVGSLAAIHVEAVWVGYVLGGRRLRWARPSRRDWLLCVPGLVVAAALLMLVGPPFAHLGESITAVIAGAFVIPLAARVRSDFAMVQRRYAGWSQPVLADWNEADLATAAFSVGLFNDRWPDPITSNMTALRAKRYAEAAEERTSVWAAWGQTIMLVSGGAVGVILGAWMTADSKPIPFESLLMTATVSLLGIGITNIVVPVFSRRAQAYERAAAGA